MAKAPKKPARSDAKTPKAKNERKSKGYIDDLKAQLGRPRALVENDLLLSQIRQLAAMRCTVAEAGAFLGVSHVTFSEFLSRNALSAEAWSIGKEIGQVSLRQMQWQTAKRGNVRMQIWLGIQMLSQTNRVDAHHSGPNGGPIEHVTTEMTPAQAAEAWQKVMANGPG